MGREKPESTTRKSDLVRLRTTRPCPSRTAAVTVTTSTPDLKVAAGVCEIGIFDGDACAKRSPGESVSAVESMRNATGSRVTRRSVSMPLPLRADRKPEQFADLSKTSDDMLSVMCKSYITYC